MELRHALTTKIRISHLRSLPRTIREGIAGRDLTAVGSGPFRRNPPTILRAALRSPGHLTIRPSDERASWRPVLNMGSEEAISTGPRDTIRKISCEAVAFRHIDDFALTGAKLDVFRNSDTGLRPSASGIRCSGLLCGISARRHVPPTETAVLAWSSFLAHKKMFSIVAAHLDRACRFLYLDASKRAVGGERCDRRPDLGGQPILHSRARYRGPKLGLFATSLLRSLSFLPPNSRRGIAILVGRKLAMGPGGGTRGGRATYRAGTQASRAPTFLPGVLFAARDRGARISRRPTHPIADRRRSAYIPSTIRNSAWMAGCGQIGPHACRRGAARAITEARGPCARPRRAGQQHYSACRLYLDLGREEVRALASTLGEASNDEPADAAWAGRR